MTAAALGRRTVGALLALAAVLVWASSAAAQPDEDDAQVSLTLTHLEAILGPGSVRELDDPSVDADQAPSPPSALELRALVEHTGDGDLDDLRLVVEVHPAVTSRAELRTALDEGMTTSALLIDEVDLRGGGTLSPGEFAGGEIAVDDEVPWADDGGVHPLRIAVVRGVTVLDEVRTAAVWLDREPQAPLLTAAVWPLDDAPWRTAGHTYPRGVAYELRPGGRIDAQLRAVERHPTVGVLLAPPAHLLEDLEDRSDGYVRTERVDGGAVESRAVEPDADGPRRSGATLQRLRNAVEGAPSGPLARPYADADLRTLLGDDLTRPLAGELATQGRLRLERQTGRAADPRTYLLPAGIDPDVLDVVPADTVVVPYRAVEGPDPEPAVTLPPAVRETMSSSGRPVTLLVGDPFLGELLDTDGSPAVAAHRVLVETAARYFESPDAEGRALAVLPPSGWAPSAELADRVLEGLGSATWLQLQDPQTIATQAQSRQRAELSGAGGSDIGSDRRGRVVELLADLEAVRDARAGDGELEVEADEDDDGSLAGRDPSALRDAVWRATSRWYPAGSTVADGLLADVETVLDRTTREVSLASGSTVTLTADTGTIPVTLQRGEGGPLDVRVEVASQARLTWPEGARSEVIRLAEGSAQTVSFPTRALSTGDFSVSVRVTDPTGRIELDRTTMSVRSTAVSRPAITAIGVVVVLLLLAGLVRRRPSDRHLEVVR